MGTDRAHLEPKRPSVAAGQVNRADRIQRMVIGCALMGLTISGLGDRVEWRTVIALALQIELLLTGLVGWCRRRCHRRAWLGWRTVSCWTMRRVRGR